MTNDHLKAWEEEIRADERKRIIELIAGKAASPPKDEINTTIYPRKHRSPILKSFKQDDVQSKVLTVLDVYDKASCGALSTQLGIPAADVSKALRTLIDLGKVRVSGQRRGKRYSLVVQRGNGIDEQRLAE